MDTCIAIRTMMFRDGIAYLQAGGGIVYDSVEEDEYVETLNKLESNVACIRNAEGKFISSMPKLFSLYMDFSSSSTYKPVLIGSHGTNLKDYHYLRQPSK